MTEQSRDSAPERATLLLRDVPSAPGVYRMLSADGAVIYVGKAKDLKKRVSSYFNRSAKAVKTAAMVAQIAAIETTITASEGEALLLENNLIKQFRPRYNVLLRDDKSFPFVFLDTQQAFPRLAFHRGARKRKGRYFGPFPSAGAVRQTLALLQKVFKVRQCEDSVFRNRARPCLQYQIDRCRGPCCGLVSEQDYGLDVEKVTMFLEGRSAALIARVSEQMEAASKALAFEQAAQYRDQILRLQQVFERQNVEGQGGSWDLIAAVASAGVVCVTRAVVRDGRHLGDRSYFPQVPADTPMEEVLAAFIAQHYAQAQWLDGSGAGAGSGSGGVGGLPAELLVSSEVAQAQELERVLGELVGRRLAIRWRLRGARAKQLESVLNNARHALASRLAASEDVQRRLRDLADQLDLDEVPKRLECFDISHTMGEATVASCVVFDGQGAVKSAYRRFNIKDVTPGDDYAAMHQALLRRYKRVQRDSPELLPDLLVIDGGKGQLAQAQSVLNELGLDAVRLLGVAKGSDRKDGLEQLFLSATGRPLILPPASPALHLIQQIRDEAHRFAISGHRARRQKARTQSQLEAIEGLGPKRRRALLLAFGGLREVREASVEAMAKVEGISRTLAQRVFDHFH